MAEPVGVKQVLNEYMQCSESDEDSEDVEK
jgi:hypothetical protein